MSYVELYYRLSLCFRPVFPKHFYDTAPVLHNKITRDTTK